MVLYFLKDELSFVLVMVLDLKKWTARLRKTLKNVYRSMVFKEPCGPSEYTLTYN